MSDLRKAAKQALQALKLAQTDINWQRNSPTRRFFRSAEKALRAALAEPGQEPEVQTETEYNIGFKAGWEKGWHYGSMVENSACAKIVERNAAICIHSPTLWDLLNANALAIRARGNTNEQ